VQWLPRAKKSHFVIHLFPFSLLAILFHRVQKDTGVWQELPLMGCFDVSDSGQITRWVDYWDSGKREAQEMTALKPTLQRRKHTDGMDKSRCHVQGGCGRELVHVKGRQGCYGPLTEIGYAHSSNVSCAPGSTPLHLSPPRCRCPVRWDAFWCASLCSPHACAALNLTALAAVPARCSLGTKPADSAPLQRQPDRSRSPTRRLMWQLLLTF
jgi:hypothetical protein